jgi:beta-glucosidase
MIPPPSESGPIRFPETFLWGAATSAYQIEGAPLADGAGPSIWHRFSHTPGRTARGDTGDVACDHYHRYAEDIALMRQIGLNAYRFSLSWGRIIPEGRGAPNPKGIDFYSRLVDLLLANGIQPLPTLYHWDLPAALDDAGGWIDPEIVDRFAEYARVAVRALGDRVSMWTTLNEPWVVVDAGYLHGVHAPGHASVLEAPIAAHHLLLAHAAAVRACRSAAGVRIGLVVNIEPKVPASDSPEDADACDRADQYMNRHYLDPVFLGRYPERMPEIYGDAWPGFPESDLRSIREPVDFLGVNYYTRGIMRDDPSGLPPRAAYVRPKDRLYTDTEWEVHPESLTRTLRWISERYGPVPLYITENGAAFRDLPAAPGGTILDSPRIDYLRRHILAAHGAMQDGVDLRGYFVWSLLDNFEWSSGYSKRFGIVAVDFDTQERTPKASARFYGDVIRSRGAALLDPASPGTV